MIGNRIRVQRELNAVSVTIQILVSCKIFYKKIHKDEEYYFRIGVTRTTPTNQTTVELPSTQPSTKRDL